MAKFHSTFGPLLSHGKFDGNDLCALASVDTMTEEQKR